METATVPGQWEPVSTSNNTLPLVLEAGADKRGRRKSWHIKMERKRRKGVIVGEAADRQKRPSWWNIFVPDHWPRSRRASQDLSRPRESVAPWVRSKSRSVDHGFAPPFDLDSLRSKVEGRFESVDKLSRADSDGGTVGKDSSGLGDRRSAQAPSVDTTTYTVEANDTLTSVAARFDTTPSELAKLNRLGARLIFPGQVLQVPLRKTSTSEDEQNSESTGETTAATDMLDSLRPVSPKPALSHVERAKTPLNDDTSHAADAEEQRSERRFLKINVRHITDGQGVVGGVLLVTPNAVMFDPNVSDPLVIEHGPELYGVIAPMEFVVNTAIYYDIAHMRVGHHHGETRSENVQKPEIYHSKNFSMFKSTDSTCNAQNSPGKDSLLVKDETFPELAPARSSPEDNESVCSCPGQDIIREGDAFPKAFERDLVTPTNLNLSDNEASSSSERKDSRQVSFESCASGSQQKSEVETAPKADPEKEAAEVFRLIEERRKSCLDHHWAVPSIDRSPEKEVDDSNLKNKKSDDSDDAADPRDEERLLVKLSCHDSGIDIRDSAAPVEQQPLEEEEEEEEIAPMPTKKVFSDADIILAPKTEWVPPRTTALTSVISSSQDSTASGSEGGRKKTSSVSFSLDSNQEGDSGGEKAEDADHKCDDPDRQESRKNKMLKRLSYPLAWMEGLTTDKDDKDPLVGLPPPTAVDAQQHSSMFSKVFSSSPINLADFGLFKTPSEESSKSPGPGPPPPTPALPDVVGRSSVGTFIRQQEPRTTPPPKPAAPKLDYRSMVSVDDMPELFVSFDIHAPNYPLLDDLELIPRPARSCEDPPLYLTLRMGKPLNKKIPKSTPVMSYGKKKMRPEYWFSVPRNRVDELYSFLMLWVPHLYGDLDDMDFKSRGYELVESDTELWDDETNGEGNGRASGRSGSVGEEGELGDLTRESWEVLSMSEELRRALYASSAGSLDIELFLPDLAGTTEILSEEHRRKLCRHLPARAEGYVWTLVFSTSQHGFSLNSMYRKMNRLESPILMVIEDTENNVFGALTSCALKVSDHFYGTGESLLFRFTPEFQVFNWTGENMYFIKGNNESLSIGAGDGKFGLWLDGDLYQGRTEQCDTYGNEPLSPHEDFVVKTLECWAFI